MANENYEGFDLTIYNLFTLLREMYYTRGETETNFLSKSGGTLGGSLTIQGNLTVQGNSYKIDTENLVVKDYTITLAKDNDSALLSMVGMVVPKYDGTNYGFFGWDADGYAYVGDLDNWDGSSAITLANNSSLQKIATIKDTATGTTSDNIMVYDQTNKVFKKAPSGRYVIEDNELVASNDNKALYNLGAFDTISGNTITRQTGYVDLGSLEWTYNSGIGCWYTSASGIAGFSDACYSVATDYTTTRVAYSSLSNGELTTSSASFNVNPYIIIKDSQSNYPKGQLQFESTTTYTESIIENQPLLTLDQNGCNFLRNEWKKGLNLCKDLLSAQGGITNNGNVISVPSGLSVNWYGVLFILTLPAGTYTMSLNPSIKSGNLGRIQINDTLSGQDLGTNYVDKTIDGARGYFSEKSTFTLTQTTTLYARYCTDVQYDGSSSGGGTTSAFTFTIMLNKGTHAYPYQEYNGDIVHKGDIIKKEIIMYNGSHTVDTNVNYVISAGFEDGNGNIDYFTKPTGLSVFIDSGNQLNYYLDSSLNMENKKLVIIYTNVL